MSKYLWQVLPQHGDGNKLLWFIFQVCKIPFQHNVSGEPRRASRRSVAPHGSPVSDLAVSSLLRDAHPPSRQILGPHTHPVPELLIFNTHLLMMLLPHICTPFPLGNLLLRQHSFKPCHILLGILKALCCRQ